MKHFLAYGNSDQASFRDNDVRAVFDYMTVPGTIAAYYEDATAAFVLSSDLDYIIDPRTPLFQGRIGSPRASHFALASWMGPSVEAIVGDEDADVRFESGDYTPDALERMTVGLVEAQREYGLRGKSVAKKMTRYRRLLAEAMGETLEPVTEGRSPSYVLAPYFVATSRMDPWHEHNRAIWAICETLENPEKVSPVVAAMDVGLIQGLLDDLPEGLSSTVFFWVSGFDERSRSVGELRALREAIERSSVDGRQLVALYGGFYSIALGTLGLAGVNNAVGYSESRAWPELPSTGAAPPRYYVPRLHSYLTPARAQLIMDTSPAYWCECDVCQDRVAGSEISIIDMTYHDVKKHFALARGREFDLVHSSSHEELAEHLSDEFERFSADVVPHLPRGLVDVDHLRRWAEALTG